MIKDNKGFIEKMGLLGKLKKWSSLWFNQFSIKNIENRRCADNDSVLIIKLDAIGDFIIWLDSAKEYKGMFTGKHCVLMCNKVCKELAEVTEYFDEIITLDIKKFEQDKKYQVEQIKNNKRRDYGMLIQTAYSRTQHMDILAASIPANKKIAFESDESKSNISRSVTSKKNRKKLDSFYDQLIPSSKENLMELQRNKEFLIGLGKKDFKSAIPRLPHIKGVQIPEYDYFLVFPGASTKIKTWRSERFAETINYIQSETNWACLVCGGLAENNLYNEILSNVEDPDRTINYCGKTSLVDLIEIVRNAKFVLSNDTSGVHYAAAVGTEAVCPFGEYNYGRFLPYQSDEGSGTVRVCSADMKCKGCSYKNMCLKCIGHFLKSGRYLCVDVLESKQINMKIDKFVFGK